MTSLAFSSIPKVQSETRVLLLERKMAGILAWLAYAGAQPRARIAQVFWTDALSGRNNLRQALFKVRHFELFSTTEPLGLSPKLEIIQSTVLLEGLDFADCPVFEEWLVVHRALAEYRQLSNLEAQIAVFLQNQNLGAALHASREWLLLEPFSEEALRYCLKLLVQQGEFGLLFEVYKTFTEGLKLEWNLLPSRATQDFMAGLLQEAASHWQEMAVRLESEMQFLASAEAWQKAADFFSHHDRQKALLASLAAHRLMLEFADVTQLEVITQQIESLAQTSNDLARAALARAQTSFSSFQFALAVRATRVGLRVCQDTVLTAQLENEQASALLRLDRIPEALQAHQQALKILRSVPEPTLLAQTLADFALAQANADLHPQAQADFLEADQLYTHLGMARERQTVLGNLAMSQRMQGNSEAALESLMLAETIARGSSGITDELRYLLANRAEVLLWREEYSLALEVLLEAKRLSGQMPMSFIWFRLAHLYSQIGAFENALEAVRNAENSAGVLERGHGMAWLIKARILRLQGLDASLPLEQARTYLEKSSAPNFRLRYCLESLAIHPNAQLARATRQEIETLGLTGLLPLALLRQAGKTNLQRAWELLKEITPIDTSKAEIACACLKNGIKVEYQENLRFIPLEFQANYKKLLVQQELFQLTLQ
jgi:tetratricopeptide (TPR) repeat protein